MSSYKHYYYHSTIHHFTQGLVSTSGFYKINVLLLGVTLGCVSSPSLSDSPPPDLAKVTNSWERNLDDFVSSLMGDVREF